MVSYLFISSFLWQKKLNMVWFGVKYLYSKMKTKFLKIESQINNNIYGAAENGMILEWVILENGGNLRSLLS